MRNVAFFLVTMVLVSCKENINVGVNKELALVGMPVPDSVANSKKSWGYNDGGKKIEYEATVSQKDTRRIVENIRARKCYTDVHFTADNAVEMNLRHKAGKDEVACRVNAGYAYENKADDGVLYKVYIDTASAHLYYKRVGSLFN
jgi:hypothetical protein